MKLFIIAPLLLMSLAQGFWPIFGPDISCTVIKVHSQIKILGLKKFPSLYQSIYNNPITSTFRIGKIQFDKIVPKTIVKNDRYEKIIISHAEGQLELELNGRPMSRNGTLKESGKLIADITCH